MHLYRVVDGVFVTKNRLGGEILIVIQNSAHNLFIHNSVFIEGQPSYIWHPNKPGWRNW